MSNPKFLFPLIFLLLFVCALCVVPPLLSAQQQRLEQAERVTGIAEDQAKSLIPLAEALKVAVQSNADTIDRQWDMIEYQRSQNGLLFICVMALVTVICAVAVIAVWRNKQEARHE